MQLYSNAPALKTPQKTPKKGEKHGVLNKTYFPPTPCDAESFIISEATRASRIHPNPHLAMIRIYPEAYGAYAS